MGNAHLTAGNQKHRFGPLAANDDEDLELDAETNAALASLIEENVRLRALVVQLSDLVLKNIVAEK